MIILGKFTSKSGNNYDCQFIPEEKIVQAVGILPDPTGARGVVFKKRAESEQEAREIISAAIASSELK